jgi:hypothetical protein
VRRFQRRKTVLIPILFDKLKDIADNSNNEQKKHNFTFNISVIGEDQQGKNITCNTVTKCFSGLILKQYLSVKPKTK